MRLRRQSRLLPVAIGAALLLAAPAYAVTGIQEYMLSDFTFFGDGHTYDYASVVDFQAGPDPDFLEDGMYIGRHPDLPNSLSWSHSLPPGLSVPPDNVTRAALWIDGACIGTPFNTVEIQDMWLWWHPLNHKWYTHDNTYFGLTGAEFFLPDFWNQGDIDVTVYAGECSLRLDAAVLMLDITPGGAVPEPGTLALLGCGLAGLGFLRLRKKS